MVHVVFAIPYAMENTLRFARAAAALPGVQLSVVSQDGPRRFPPEFVDGLVGFEQVADGMKADDLSRAVGALQQKHGKVDRLIGILEQVQEALAEVRERLRIRGMDRQTARNFRAKSQMKRMFAEHGIPCARHRLCSSLDEALRFAAEVGYPLVGKPPDGAGAKATSRCEDEQELRSFVRAIQPRPGREVLLEEFVVGREFSFDSVTLHGQHVFHNICCYYPTPLEVMDNPWIQWCVVLPRELDRPEFADIHRLGPRALSVLGMWTGMSHLEWFRRGDGSIAVSEVAARPPGAQFMSLIGHVLDVDMYRAFAQLMVFETFRAPPRRYAVAAAYLRGQVPADVGPAPKRSAADLVIRSVQGLDRIRQKLGDLIVEAKLPVIGKAPAATYEGDGYLVVRHPETEVVGAAVQEIVRSVRVVLGPRPPREPASQPRPPAGGE